MAFSRASQFAIATAVLLGLSCSTTPSQRKDGSSVSLKNPRPTPSLKTANIVASSEIFSTLQRQIAIQSVISQIFPGLVFEEKNSEGITTPLSLDRITPEHIAALLSLPEPVGNFAPLFLVKSTGE